MKSLAWAALPLLSCSLLACSTSSGEFDELAGETAEDDIVEGKADSAVDGSYTYFSVQQDFRKCASPMCGGFFLDRVNRSETKCHDGRNSASCYTPELDMSESGLTPAAFDKLREAAGLSVTDGARVLLRGRFAKTNSTISPELGRFVVTEVWIAQGPTPPDGVFVRVKDNGVRCIAAPCASTTEKALNTSRSANIADIDFSDAGIDDSVLEQLGLDMFEPSGFIMAGDRYTFKFEGRKGKGRTATAVYRRMLETDDAGACFVGGCSGQVCSDQEGVITTCEWRDEYACYQSAACERQADGNCGWTSSEELQACLGTAN